MQRDEQRLASVTAALNLAGRYALICTHSENVLMLTGYWPVMGNAVAIIRSDGFVAALVPEDERDLAAAGWLDKLSTFAPASLERMTTTEMALRDPLRALAAELDLPRRRVGFEGGATLEPASYLAVHEFGPAIEHLLADCIPEVDLSSAHELLARLRSRKTPAEIAHIRAVCAIATQAYESGLRSARWDAAEARIADTFRSGLARDAGDAESHRADGFIYCMAGPNSAQAYKAYQRSTGRRAREGELALIHCNSFMHGFWTDLTRTYRAGKTAPPGERGARQQRMHAAIIEARAAALAAIRPGVPACDVDHAARSVLARHGFGPQFLHPTGHGIGFGANDHTAIPCLHPKSDHILAAGMVCNVEPGIYFAGEEGMRHCDMVTVTETGVEVLTDFQTGTELLSLQ